MFDFLSEGLDKTFSKIRGYGKITESNIDDALREVRLALLEADVNYKVVKNFTTRVKGEALGQKVWTSINPQDKFIKIIHDEIENLLAGDDNNLIFNKDITVMMLAGLQGTGKTSSAGKIANLVRKKYKKRPLLVACDIYRPGATDQLKELGKELNIPVFSEDKDPVQIAKNSLRYAKENKLNYIIIDTAGRLEIDDKLMTELVNINKEVKADEIMLVLDSLIGGTGIDVTLGFKEKLDITGVFLSKFDADTRGGIALSIREMTNIPIKLVGTGERMGDIDTFDPKRMAGRILGMGDVVSLVNKAEEAIDEEEAKKLGKKMLEGTFTLNDFLDQLKMVRSMGPLDKLIRLIPGAKKMGLTNVKIDPKQISRIEAIVLSMTEEEKNDPRILKASRKRRVANGSGTTVQEVNTLIKNFEESKKMMKNFKNLW